MTARAELNERKPQPKKPSDIPVARGVSPPPVPVRRPQPRPAGQPPKPAARRPTVPPPLPRTATPPETPSAFAFNDSNGRSVVRRPVRKASKPHRGWTLGVEIGAVVVLAGFFMAAGWWFLGGRTTPVPPPENARNETKATKPVAPGVVAEPPKSVAKPAPSPAPIVKEQPKPVEKPVEKPAAPVTPPEPPSTRPAPPPRPSTPAVTNLTFARDIFPMLKSKCYSCHGENKKKIKGGLDISSLTLLEKGGDSGPAVNRKDPETSPLWDSVASGQMPPGKGTKLSESEKKKLHDWIVGGGK